ncbi:MAG TPA: PAS domain S-box protein [Flavisolibacter sp.]|nr:PAS domain S-box protein [Flavisolibacter sp.]
MLSSPIVNDQSEDAPDFAQFAGHPLPTWIIDAQQLHVRFANKAAASFYGYTSEEFRLLNFQDLIVEKSKKSFFHLTTQTLSRFNLSCDLKKKNSEEVAVELYASTFKIGDTLHYHLISLVPGVKEGSAKPRSPEFAVNEQEKHDQLRYEATILENVSDIIVTTDLGFRVKVWNKSAEKFYQISAADAKGKRMSELVNLSFSDSSFEQSQSILEQSGFWQGEVSFTNKIGKEIYFFYTVKNVYCENGEKIGYMGIGRDITEKKRTEQKIRQSEEFYRALIAESLDGMILLDEEATIAFASPSVKNVLGYEVNEIVGRNGFEFVHPDDIKSAFESFQKEVIQNPDVKFIVVRLLNKQGNWVWCMVRGHNLLKNPNVGRVAIYFHDDTLRKEASEALKESEKRFRTLIKELYVGVILQDAEGRVLMTNDATFKMFGVAESDLVGRRIWDMYTKIVKEDGTPFDISERPSRQAIATKKAVKDVVMGIWHPRRKEYIWLLLCADPILDDEGKLIHIVSSFMDITERKRLEQKLISEQIGHQRELTQATIDGQENERREIGKELHDNIGQQLTTVKLFLDLAKSSADEATGEMVNMALKGVSDLINEIRAMSRSLVPSTLKDLGLVESVNELVDAHLRSQPLEIDFNANEFYEESLRENQQLAVFRIIQEQLNNIVKNAQAEHVFIRLSTDKIKNVVIVEIKDDGKGFDAKKTKKGPGFMNIRNRIELFDGKIEVSTKAGKGCLLRVSMPYTPAVP